MDNAMISLLAPVAVSPQDIDEWVEELAYRLRARWRFTGVGIGRLVRACPSEGGDWLIELDLRGRSGPPEKDIALAAILTDLERLGLRPQLFVGAGAVPPPSLAPAERTYGV